MRQINPYPMATATAGTGVTLMKKVKSLLGLALAGGLILSSQVNAATYYFHTDHLGTPQVLTDTNQAVVWQGDYDPFGGVTETVSNVEQNLRFPGQYYDVESGLNYNYFRDYDPGLGRYVQSDPIGLDGGMNTYSYVGGSPLSYSDPLGLRPPSAVPPGVSMQQNILEARSMTPFEFYSAVRSGGKWDYKKQGMQYRCLST